mmetsp:Transcript_2144/g.8301  ORF Transcript_2144/g.8301 Transcript_2144/m.8301 type:complete len:211 (-) Transcript_2144:48-680(-)
MRSTGLLACEDVAAIPSTTPAYCPGPGEVRRSLLGTRPDQNCSNALAWSDAARRGRMVAPVTRCGVRSVRAASDGKVVRSSRLVARPMPATVVSMVSPSGPVRIVKAPPPREVDMSCAAAPLARGVFARAPSIVPERLGPPQGRSGQGVPEARPGCLSNGTQGPRSRSRGAEQQSVAGVRSLRKPRRSPASRPKRFRPAARRGLQRLRTR